MNKRIPVLLALLMSVTALLQGAACSSCDCQATDQTFLWLRTPYQLNSPERLALSRGFMSRGGDVLNGQLYVTIFGGRSTRSSHLAQYFFPNCREALNVTESVTPTTDILANNINIFTQEGISGTGPGFASTIAIHPRHTFVGAGLTYRQEFARRCNGRKFWFELSAPIITVRNNINFEECITNAGGGVATGFTGAFANATEAFSSPEWLFGRMDDCRHKKTKLGDLEVILGYELIEQEATHAEAYIGAIFPTGNRPKGRTVFEPIVGRNKHWGLLSGTSFGTELWHNCDDTRAVWMEFDISGEYLFSRREVRSFNLKNRPFSRYTYVYCTQEAAQAAADAATAGDVATARTAGTPGINLFTQCVKVKPYLNSTINSALIYTSCNLQLEGGYNFFTKQAECVRLDTNFLPVSAVRAATGGGATNNVQQIGNDYDGVNDLPVALYAENIITAADLDLRSAASPSQFIHTFYGAVGYTWSFWPRFLPTTSLGGSYEYTQTNTALDRWMVWGKMAFLF